jgi:ABC-type multidrug transport system fused ATPase/permease subunit
LPGGSQAPRGILDTAIVLFIPIGLKPHRAFAVYWRPFGKGYGVLLAEGLTAIRGERLVFQDLSFAVPEGGALILSGRNGAGKSTLMRCPTAPSMDFGWRFWATRTR